MFFKCKMCGGNIEFAEGATVGVCDSCGTKQTLPRLDDERRANLYDRANHFRRNNEFDKAMGIYEQILEEDNSDAEAYWSLVLCNYGIEYVEDPATHKRVPTVNRAQFTSVFDDENYKSALRYADGSQKSIYEEEAAIINDIQKGILAISQREEPFDIFICYKETDNNGRRTQDSVLANDLYHQLTNEGFKVFFSRITLEDKLGTAYEPYIFAALNSAKVMVVLGTRPEHFSAVWVKNEWSRYLALVKQSGEKKMLIPAYRDMDPYDLPEEFSHLQAQDMSKLGFMQDLIRGIKKIIGADEPKPTVTESVTVSVPGASGGDKAALLKRAYMYLEDGDFSSAGTYCERVLDMDPENADAYLGKLMISKKCRKQSDLQDVPESFEEDNNYQKILRFGSDDLKKNLQSYLTVISDRIENARQKSIYDEALSIMDSAGDVEEEYRKAAEIFGKIPGYGDAAQLIETCLKRVDAIESKKADIYNLALGQMGAANSKKEFKAVLQLFKDISGYSDAVEKIEECQKIIDGFVRKKRIKIVSVIFGIIILIGIIMATIFIFIPAQRYKKGISLMEKERYAEAIESFKKAESVGSYKDSYDQMMTAYYSLGVEYMSNEQYMEAVNAFRSAFRYDKVLEAYYYYGEECVKNKDYKAASSAYFSAQDYADAPEKARRYQLFDVSVGDTIKMGMLEQSFLDQKDDIKWTVLCVEDEKALVISEDCLFYSQDEIKDWGEGKVRSMLNNDFYNQAFSDDEARRIVLTELDNGEYGNTLDKIFLLNSDEVEEYFKSESSRVAKYTEYALNQTRIYNDEYEYSNVSKEGRIIEGWMLRDPGATEDNNVWYVNREGEIELWCRPYQYAIRPAMWIVLFDISSDEDFYSDEDTFEEEEIDGGELIEKFLDGEIPAYSLDRTPMYLNEFTGYNGNPLDKTEALFIDLDENGNDEDDVMFYVISGDQYYDGIWFYATDNKVYWELFNVLAAANREWHASR